MHFLLYMTPVPSSKNISESTSDKYNSQSLQALSLALPLVALPRGHITKGFVQHVRSLDFILKLMVNILRFVSPRVTWGDLHFGKYLSGYVTAKNKPDSILDLLL